MYLLIEHAGTLEHLKIAENIQYFAEDNFGCSCDTVVGDEGDINLYEEKLTKFATFKAEPSNEDLN